MNNALALIVDDEADIRELLRITLTGLGVEVVEAADISSAKKALEKSKFSLCITDMRLPDGDGIELIEYIQKKFSKIPVAMLTAYGSIEAAVASLKAGAFDFLSKPVDLKVLRNLVIATLKLRQTSVSARTASQLELLGQSKVIEDLRAKITKLARTQAPVSIYGAAGTGKELVARMIHEQGPRASKPFVVASCGAIPPALIEEEFFGAGVNQSTPFGDNSGLLQSANGGTLFLDEVGDLPINMQVKLLRVIVDKAIRIPGALSEIPIDIRVLCSTHKDLHNLVKLGAFRQDLFYRLNVIELHIPTLLERKEDIPLLANAILDRLALEQKASRPTLSERSLNRLLSYSFPGNVCELESILERALALCENNMIEPADLELPGHANLIPKVERDMPMIASMRSASSENHPPAFIVPEQPLNALLGNVEKDAIIKVMDRNRWNRSSAAKELGITLRALRYRLKKLNLDD